MTLKVKCINKSDFLFELKGKKINKLKIKNHKLLSNY